MTWIPSIVTTVLLGLILWLGRRSLEAAITESVTHVFDGKLERLRAELRQREEVLKADLRMKESELASPRSVEMAALSSRQAVLDQRRIQAVDQLWSGVTALAPAKSVAPFMSVINVESAASLAKHRPAIRELFASMSSGFDPKKVHDGAAAKARPFVPPFVWALFVAYQAIAMYAVVRCEMVHRGMDPTNVMNREAVKMLVNAVLPHLEPHMNTIEQAGYYPLLEELEERLLSELQRMLSGDEVDVASLNRAAEIVRRSRDVLRSVQRESMHVDDGGDESPTKAT